jgi:hypothetical protein
MIAYKYSAIYDNISDINNYSSHDAYIYKNHRMTEEPFIICSGQYYDWKFQNISTIFLCSKNEVTVSINDSRSITIKDKA